MDQKNDADRRRSQGSDPSDYGSTPQLSSKLRDKLQKLAKWRIEPSSIEFPEDAPEYQGGFATVSRAFLVSNSSPKTWLGYLAHLIGMGGTPERKAIGVKKLIIENGKDKERVLGLALREAEFLTDLSHENVIELEGFVEDLSGDRVWLVFPWADNGSLKDFVASANWEIPERIQLIADVVVGVDYLHSRNPPIHHGDLKSANVLVNSNCRAVITDFGSARRFTKKDPPLQPEKSKTGAQPVLSLGTELCEATNTITLKGNHFTLRWAAPELLLEDEPGMEPGLWSDIWALGWIFYEVMTNSIPFPNLKRDSAVIIHVIQGNLPATADDASMMLIRALYSLMITCWSIDPSKRPTAEDCIRLMSWMPMIAPDPQRASNKSDSQARSPELLIKLGHMYRYQNDYTNASKLYTEALGIYTETADKAGRAEALLGLGMAHKLQNKYSEAATFYSEVLQICSDTGNRERSVPALWGLAEVHRLQHKYSEAVALYSAAIQICTDIGDKGGRADALLGLAGVYRIQKQFDQAVQLFTEALQIRIDIGDRNGEGWARMCLGDVHRDQGQSDDAIRLYEQAERIFGETGATGFELQASNRAAFSRVMLWSRQPELFLDRARVSS